MSAARNQCRRPRNFLHQSWTRKAFGIDIIYGVGRVSCLRCARRHSDAVTNPSKRQGFYLSLDIADRLISR